MRWDGKKVAAFSKIEAAVEAVDHEVSVKGRAFAEAAREGADWRREPASAALLDRLRQIAGPSPRTVGEALQLLSLHGLLRG